MHHSAGNQRVAASRVLHVTMALVASVVLFTPALTAGQTLEEADSLSNEGRWEEAAGFYRGLIDVNSGNARAWYGLARSLHELGEQQSAADAYRRTIQLNHNPARTRFHFARFEASAGNRDEALRLLEEARQNGMTAFQVLLQTSEFASLRDDSEFQAIVEKMKPCVAPEYRHFDFWIGDWDVETPAGQPAGTNRIRRTQGQCVLLEEWTSASGGTGTSFNTFNVQKGMWQQFWVDTQGSVLELSGGLEEDAMVMTSDPAVTPRHRITWTPNADGSVRQLWESSTDDGKSWSTAFDGIYRKKTASN